MILVLILTRGWLQFITFVFATLQMFLKGFSTLVNEQNCFEDETEMSTSHKQFLSRDADATS